MARTGTNRRSPSTSQKPPRPKSRRRHDLSAIDHAVRLIHYVCCLAGSATLIDDLQAESSDDDLHAAVANHDSAALVDWLLAALSYQGISDQVAFNYMEEHGQATWHEIKRNLAKRASCPKLASYWHFHGCRYHKTSHTCAEPDHISKCPLPTHDLRNGRLNQTAFSLVLFVRDIADGDLIGWIDRQLHAADEPTDPDRLVHLHEAIIGPLRQIYGVADKVLTMALSCILLSAASDRPLWHEVGAGMIAVDTLVHNFLHRTGILDRFDAVHAYGPGCYQHGGCAEILQAVAERIDAQQFNPSFPQTFPRFVQHAIWRFCSQQGLDICNGNRIDDRKSCDNVYCQIYRICDRYF